MNITQEKVDDLNAILKVKIEAGDYQDSYTTALKTTRKRAQMQGFRQGMVPMGLVKKMYGKSILADEMNKLLSESIQKYIADEKLEILGSPIPTEEGENGDWDNPTDFEFTYEIGLAPEFKLDIKNEKFTLHTIAVDDTMIDKQTDDLTRRYGKLIEAEESTEKDMLYGDFIELKEDGEIKEGGIMHQSTVSLEFMENEEARKTMLGKKKGDIVVVNPHDISKGGADTAAMLGIKKEELDTIGDKFNFRIGEIKRMEAAEVNQELFDKVYGEGEVANSEDFRNRVADDMGRMFANDTERMFQRDVSEEIVDRTSFELPNAFLKKWIRVSNEKPISEEQIEQEYDGYASGLKWQLIKNRLIGENNIDVQNEEVLGYQKAAIANQYAQYGLPAPSDEELTETANRSLAEADSRRRIIDSLFDNKVVQFIKENAQVENLEVSYDDFVNLAKKGNQE